MLHLSVLSVKLGSNSNGNRSSEEMVCSDGSQVRQNCFGWESGVGRRRENEAYIFNCQHIECYIYQQELGSSSNSHKR